MLKSYELEGICMPLGYFKVGKKRELVVWEGQEKGRKDGDFWTETQEQLHSCLERSQHKTTDLRP